MIPYTPESYELMHRGTLALAQIEANGMRVDTDYLETTARRTERKIKHLRAQMAENEVSVAWRRRFGGKTNFGSNDQLGKVLFDVMKFPIPDEARTPGGSYRTDEDTLAAIDHPFVKAHVYIGKLEKAASTYLRGFLAEAVDGYIHPFFNLHITRTYRSSSDSPNFQNIPVRDPEIGKLVRTAFIPRPGRQIWELDFKGIEVSVSACYHKDPRMMTYLRDPTKDMHRDMAMQIFMLSLEQVNKMSRFVAKSNFVFAQFYGDWFIDCARRLWEAIARDHLMVGETPMAEHLRAKGITHLGLLNPKVDPTIGSFEKHIKAVEKDFWDVRFPVYKRWKQEWFAAYQKQGWFKTLTGFICQGYMKRNEVINYGTQGSAFHCLLWVLIQLVEKELAKRKMKTLLVGQIHDSMVADGPPEERDEFIGVVRELVEVALPKHWSWLIVPMAIEADVCETDAPWATKKGLPLGAIVRDDKDTGWIGSTDLRRRKSNGNDR